LVLISGTGVYDVNVEFDIDDGVATLAVTGEVDLSSADRLQELGLVALAEIVSTLRIRLTDVSFIDSSGLAALISIKNAADRGRQVVILERPSERVTRLLEVAGLVAHFQIE
jgi:anti-sigma B factor antagonist